LLNKTTGDPWMQSKNIEFLSNAGEALAGIGDLQD
jgi:hypothetical protein